jgi:hypothetical protein
MIRVTIFSGHEGQLRVDKGVYLTLFGGCELIRPTIARQLFAVREAEEQAEAAGRMVGGPHGCGFPVGHGGRMRYGRRPHRAGPFFLTLFGGVEIKSPTLAEEFLDLRESVRSGVLDMKDWDEAMARLRHLDLSIASFTLFGGFNECKLPSEDEEIDSLAIQRHLGNIPEDAGRILQLGIGQRTAERAATVHRALQAVA